MADRNIGKPWSPHEDKLLTQAIAVHGEVDKWKIIALSVPGRTNKACRKRWLHSLSPSIKKTAWTVEEDQKLLELYGIYNTKWAVIARHIPGRTDDACSKRYREALDPTLKKDEWTADEDHRLCQLHDQLGGRWGQIGQELQRSGLGCRNRWRLLQRKKPPEVTPEPSLATTFSRPSGLTDHSPYFLSNQTTPWPPTSQETSTIPFTSHPPVSAGAHSPSWQPLLEPPSAFHYEAHVSPYHDAMIRTPHHDAQDQLRKVALPVSGDDARLSSFMPDTHRSQTPPPFQYSSSSLSTALSDPTIPKPLPPVHLNVPQFPTESTYNPHTQSPISGNSSDDPALPICPHGGNDYAYDGDDVHMSDDASMTYADSRRDPSTLSTHSLIRIPMITFNSGANGKVHGSSNLYREPAEGESSGYGSTPVLSPSGSHSSHNDLHPSSSSTPVISPLSSPHPSSSPIDLPSTSPGPPHPSPFFGHYRSSQIGRQKPASRRRPISQAPPRLNSELPATSDPSVRPYCCGHERCWPSHMHESQSRFAKSKELSDHNKQMHSSSPGGDKPYRCGLEGCGKSWRSINGLQYHLQISRSHFQNAISSNFSPNLSQRNLDPPSPHASNSESSEKPKKKLYPCPNPNCVNEYRQLGGLRYHLTHGHPEDMPAQLADVPPTLARKVAEKLRAKVPGS